MIEKELEEKERYDKLYQKLSDLHHEIYSWHLKLSEIAYKLYGNEKFAGMYELGIMRQKIRHREEEIEQNWLKEEEDDGQE